MGGSLEILVNNGVGLLWVCSEHLSSGVPFFLGGEGVQGWGYRGDFLLSFLLL